MARKQKSARGHGWLERMARQVTGWTGTSQAFAGAVAVVAIWALLGPVFHFSDTWQLVINTGTTIVTFLMVFLIQRTQNHDNEAVQLKLNELIAALDGASNHLINIEELTEDELRTIHRHFHKLARLARDDASATATHSVEEAETRHKRKASRH
jgi:low affinity Fe/Cu permease